MTEALDGLPQTAQRRVESQLAGGVTGSLFSAPAAASARSVGLEPVGEVFGCLVINLGWTGGGCSWWGSGGGLPGWGAGGALGGWATSPITTSGRSQSGGFAPYVNAFEAAWYGALQRMLIEARALGAHGVVGVRITRTRLQNSVWEFTALGTAVRSSDPSMVPFPADVRNVWSTNLRAEDCASAILSGYLPHEIVLGISVSSKHEDMELKQQRSVWAGNTEITGLTLLIQAARNESRARLAARATRADGAQLVITDLDLSEFDTPCSQDAVDLHAESVIVGTTLIPLPRASHRAETAKVTTVLPLHDLTA
ncbi:MAG TPA: heavy metal-binding domain-containing protein [Microbacteriaceae bacterium]